MSGERNVKSDKRKHEHAVSSKELVQPGTIDYGAFLKSRYEMSDEPHVQPTSSTSHELTLTVEQIPSNSVLDQAIAFLPLLSEANMKLEAAMKERRRDVFDMESFIEDGSAHIKLDLALGIADLYTPEAVVKAEKVVHGQGFDLNSMGCSSSSDASGDENEHEIENESPSNLEFGDDVTSIIRPKCNSQTFFPSLEDLNLPQHKRAKSNAFDIKEAS